MKKNKTMRFASLLLVAVLITTCAISGTFAKYTTSSDAAGSARVAAFGVEVTAGTDDDSLFSTEYAAPDDDTTITVKSSTSMNVVAPGTSGQMNSVSITGTPEVSVEVAIADATVTLTGDWKDAEGNFYFPLTFTIGGTEIKGSEYSSVDDLTEALQAALSGEGSTAAQTFEPGTDLSEVEINAVAISWEWDFDDNGAGTNDAKDTALGNAAATALADDEDTVPAIEIDFGITVTQVD